MLPSPNIFTPLRRRRRISTSVHEDEGEGGEAEQGWHLFFFFFLLQGCVVESLKRLRFVLESVDLFR
jgi:hypothetical protein